MGYNFIERIIDGKFSLGEDFRQTGRDIWNFCELVQKHQSKILISATIIWGLSMGYLVLGKINQYMKTPRYGFDFPSIKFNGTCVRFYDDIAPGMRAFIEYDRKKMQIAGTDEDDDSCNFLLPKKALKAGEFIVSAIDRDGNKSKPKTLYTLEGVVLEKNPN